MDMLPEGFADLTEHDQRIVIEEEVKELMVKAHALMKHLPPDPPAPRDPTALNVLHLCDWFGALEARIRFYTRAAEDIANEAGETCIIRASSDLLDHVTHFGELLNRAHRRKVVPREGDDCEPDEDEDETESPAARAGANRAETDQEDGPRGDRTAP